MSLLRRNAEFRRLFIAHAISRSGDAFNTVALVVLVFDLTRSGRGVAITVVLEVLPVLLIGPVAGTVADRYPRRRVMVCADLLRAALVGILAVAHGSVGTAYAVAFGMSVGSLLFNPASSSLLPDVVSDDELVTANSAMWSVAVVAQIVLAPLAGALIAWAGVGAAFGINAASFVVSAVVLRNLGAGRTPAAIAVRGWRGVFDGVDAIRRHLLLRRLAIVQVLASLSAGATSGLLVVYASERLDVGPSGFGLLLAAIGIGAATGPLVLRRWIRAAHPGWLFGPYAVRGGVDLVLAATRTPAVAVGALAAYGVSTSTGMITYQSTLQSGIDPAVRGRAFATFDALWNAARLASLGAGGLLTDSLGIEAVYVCGGALLLLAFLVGVIPTNAAAHAPVP